MKVPQKRPDRQLPKAREATQNEVMGSMGSMYVCSIVCERTSVNSFIIPKLGTARAGGFYVKVFVIHRPPVALPNFGSIWASASYRPQRYGESRRRGGQFDK
jgi:hypothetical protein